MRHLRRFCIWSPVWLGVIGGIIFYSCLALAEMKGFQSFVPVWFLVPTVFWSQLVYGGIPYLVALYLFFKKTNLNNTCSYCLQVALLPIRFVAIFIVALAIVQILNREFHAFDLWRLSLRALMIAYLYVAAWLTIDLIVQAFRRTGRSIWKH